VYTTHVTITLVKKPPAKKHKRHKKHKQTKRRHSH
jgi:hypothetical protein